MASLRASLSEFGWRRRVFSLVVLGFLGLVVWTVLEHGIGAALGQLPYDAADHRIHDFTFALIFLTAGVGMVVQLRKPSENVAGQVMALIPWVGAVLAFALARFVGHILIIIAIFGVLTLLAAVLHPAGRDFFRSFSVSRVNWVLLTLVIIAAVPLLAFASTNVGLQAGASGPSHGHGGAATGHGAAATDDEGGAGTHDEAVHQEHIDAGHFGLMAAFSFIVIGVGLLASLRPDGWWLTAWVAGFFPALIGLASVVFPDDASSFGLAWGLAAIVWGVTFVAVAELIRRRGRSHPGRAGQS